MTAQLIVPSTFPTEPGLYPDIPEALYHRSRDTLSSTGAKTLAHKTPAQFAWDRDHGRAPKPAFDVGTAAHAAVLGKDADRLVFLDHDDYKTKKAQQERDEAYAEGKTPILTTQADQVKRMADSVRAHPTAGRIFGRTDCQAEVTALGRDPETGVMCRARFDWLLPIVPGQPVRFVDLKTGDDASRDGMARSMNQWNYPGQIDFYGSVLRWALGLDDDVPVLGTLVFVEKTEPHLIGLGQPDEQSVSWAHEDNRRARHLFARCTRSGSWPGHDEGVVSLSLPGWRLGLYDHLYPTGRFEPDDFEDYL